MRLIRLLIKWLLSLSSDEAFLAWGLPLIWPAAVIAVGVVGGYSWFVILTVGTILFAYVVWLMNWLDAWRLRNDVASKLTFEAVRTTLLADGDAPVTGVMLGFWLRSLAPYPLVFRVLEITTQMGTRTPQRPASPDQQVYAVDPGQLGYFDHDAIPVPGTEFLQENEGWLKATVEFKRPHSKRAHTLQINKRLVPGRDQYGNPKWQPYDV